MKKAAQDGLYAAFDLGTFSLKATVTELNNSRPRLASIDEENIKPVGDFPSEEDHRVHLIETLQTLASRLPLKECRKVSLLFSNREMQVKIIELPSQVQLDQIEKILNWEAKKLLSPAYRDEPYSFTYRIVKENPFSVALAVIPQRLLERFLELFEKAGIYIDGVYAEVFSAHSLEQVVDQTGLPALSLVNFGHNGTHLQIFSSGELRFYRFIPSGMSEMSQPPKENELEIYAQKIRFSFDYFRAVSKLNQIDAVFFMGGGAAQPNILPFHRTYFNPARINIVDISSHIDISPVLPDLSESSPPEEKQRRLLVFLPAIGTTLSLLSSESDSMNFALRLKRKNQEKRIQELSKSMPVIVGLAGLLLIIVLLFWQKSNLQAELAEITRKLDNARIDSEAANIKITRARAASQTGVKLSPAARKTLAPVLAKQHAMQHILFFVGNRKPETVKVTEILIRTAAEGENISLQNLQTQQDQFQDSESPAGETNPFVSSLAADAAGSDQYNEGLGGKQIIIRGTCDGMDALASFSENLMTSTLIERLRTVETRKKSGREIEFLIRGEMP